MGPEHRNAGIIAGSKGAGQIAGPALRGLSHPETSRQGNLFGMIGMAIAQRLNGEGKVGATHMGSGFDAWYPGYIDYNPVWSPDADRVVLVLAVIVIWLGLAVSRAHRA